ncbi:hypothetical protein LTR86_005837 [Recurvomyces mirabilis]|nr:hypothetical protein LTR86_005837 [Recurvomyces mirabilis]
MSDGLPDPNILPFLVKRHQEAGFHPIVALQESTGTAIKREVMSVIAEGVSTPEAIDRVFVEMYSGNKSGPCRMMDQVGLDIVEFIEQHYINERGLPSDHLDFIHKEYIQPGKLRNKTPTKGGWYPPSEGSRLRTLFLDSGLAEPLSENTLPKIMKSGRILKLPSELAQHPIELLGGQALPDGLDYCSADSHLYWTCMGVPSVNDGAVYGAELGLDGIKGDIKTVVQAGDVHTPKQLVVDQQTKKIYFCDREGLRVMRVNTDGSELETIVQNGDWTDDRQSEDQHKWCVGITVAPSVGKFFWTQKGSSKATQGRIFSANIDMPQGQNASSRTDIQVVMDKLPEPIDLEFDETSEELYWTDRGELPFGNTLNKKHMPKGLSDRGGLGNGQVILVQGFGETIGLDIDFEQRVAYVTDLGGRLWKVQLDGTGSKLKEKLYERDTGSFTGVTFIRN